MNVTPKLLIRLAIVLAIPAGLLATSVQRGAGAPGPMPGPSKPEPHLSNIKQLTFSGQNAEAYFSADGSRISFQSMDGTQKCDQIYTMKPDGSDRKPGQHRQRRHDVCVHLPGQQIDPVRIDAPGWPRVPAADGNGEWLRLGRSSKATTSSRRTSTARIPCN